MKLFIKRELHLIILLLLTDAVFIFATWLIRSEAIKYMSLFILLFTLLVLAVGFAAELYKRRKDEAALLNFLENPENETKELLLNRFGNSEAVRTLCTRYVNAQSLINEKTVELSEYREYIEAWVHEVKTPLSLSTLICDNHREEMSPYVYAQLNYIRLRLNENVERILYYARLQAEHSDIKFTWFRLDECTKEILSEYSSFVKEKKITLSEKLLPLEVASDCRTVRFILSQLISNAVKYAGSENGRITIAMRQNGDKIYLGVYNNGEGVPPEDLPFIFDKGFTGGCKNRQKATGMGLYLVRKYAEKLCAEVQTVSNIPFKSGFGIELIFTL